MHELVRILYGAVRSIWDRPKWKSDLNVNARMRTEIDLNDCEHVLKANWDRIWDWSKSHRFQSIDPYDWILSFRIQHKIKYVKHSSNAFPSCFSIWVWQTDLPISSGWWEISRGRSPAVSNIPVCSVRKLNSLEFLYGVAVCGVYLLSTCSFVFFCLYSLQWRSYITCFKLRRLHAMQRL